MAATVITIAVEKGGCGKTVTTSNLAYLMGDEGKKVLCLDTDPQGNLTFALTGGNAITSKAFANRSLYDMIDGFRYNTQTRDFIVESEYENVDLIPANDQTPRLSKRLEDLYTDAQPTRTSSPLCWTSPSASSSRRCPRWSRTSITRIAWPSRCVRG